MNNTSENNTTDRPETQARTERKNIWGATAELWGIMDTPKGYKVNTQMLIERYTQYPPIRYAESGAYYKYLAKGVWEETNDISIRKVCLSRLKKHRQVQPVLQAWCYLFPVSLRSQQSAPQKFFFTVAFCSSVAQDNT